MRYISLEPTDRFILTRLKKKSYSIQDSYGIFIFTKHLPMISIEFDIRDFINNKNVYLTQYLNGKWSQAVSFSDDHIHHYGMDIESNLIYIK